MISGWPANSFFTYPPYWTPYHPAATAVCAVALTSLTFFLHSWKLTVHDFRYILPVIWLYTQTPLLPNHSQKSVTPLQSNLYSIQSIKRNFAISLSWTPLPHSHPAKHNQTFRVLPFIACQSWQRIHTSLRKSHLFPLTIIASSPLSRAQLLEKKITTCWWSGVSLHIISGHR